MGKTAKIILSIVVLVIVAGGAFYGGMLYKASQTPARTAFTSRTGGTRFASGANFVTGVITAEDSQTITVKSRDGSSKIILYSPTTEVSKFASDSLSDVVVGQTIMASGTTNSDGSITAQSIQIRPAMPASSTPTSAQ